MAQQLQVQREVCARVPTACGEFTLCVYKNNQDMKEHLALVRGQVAGAADLLVRVHSECLTGDVFSSRRCDCGEQLHRSMEMIAAEERGVVLYLRQEGRGIGLTAKMHAYNLQDTGMDTVDANLALGHAEDERDYRIAALMLKDLGVRSVRLLTNNPQKMEDLSLSGIPILARVGIEPTVYPDNRTYLATKASRMNHWITLDADPVAAGDHGRHSH